jgi:predicted dithiol-disulfide oxidoreductase (DUF899 family)
MTKETDVQARIEALEREIREKTEALATLRRQQPCEPVADHVLHGPDGARVPLSGLFGEKRDLIVIHNMGSRCPYCTLWADGFQGVLPHLEDRAAVVLVSPDDPATQQRFAASRGWRFRMLSNGDSGFTEAVGYQGEKDGKTWVWPGFSTFRREEDGRVTRVAHAAFGPGDPYCSVWHLFALLDGGAADWQPRFAYQAPGSTIRPR